MADDADRLEIIGFVPPELAGLNGKLIQDLLEIVENYGASENGLRYIRIRGIPVIVAVVENTVGKMLQVFPPNVVGSFSVATTLLTKATMVTWDVRVPLATVVALVEAIDSKLRAEGLIDPDTGERKPLPRPVLYRVEEVFPKRGALRLVGPGDPPVPILVGLFDHPDEVAVLQTPSGRMALCRAKDGPYHARKSQLSEEVLAERGLADQQSYDSLELRLAMLEVEERLDAEFGPDPYADDSDVPSA